MSLRFSILVIIAAAILGGCSARLDDGADFRATVHLLLDGKPQLALSKCERILKDDPEHFEALLLRGEIQRMIFGRGRYRCVRVRRRYLIFWGWITRLLKNVMFELFILFLVHYDKWKSLVIKIP